MLLKFSDLTKDQIAHLEKVFYQRKILDAEKKYKYFFNDDGICEYAE